MRDSMSKEDCNTILPLKATQVSINPPADEEFDVEAQFVPTDTTGKVR